MLSCLANVPYPAALLLETVRRGSMVVEDAIPRQESETGYCDSTRPSSRSVYTRQGPGDAKRSSYKRQVLDTDEEKEIWDPMGERSRPAASWSREAVILSGL